MLAKLSIADDEAIYRISVLMYKIETGIYKTTACIFASFTRIIRYQQLD